MTIVELTIRETPPDKAWRRYDHMTLDEALSRHVKAGYSLPETVYKWGGWSWLLPIESEVRK